VRPTRRRLLEAVRSEERDEVIVIVGGAPRALGREAVGRVSGAITVLGSASTSTTLPSFKTRRGNGISKRASRIAPTLDGLVVHHADAAGEALEQRPAAGLERVGAEHLRPDAERVAVDYDGRRRAVQPAHGTVGKRRLAGKEQQRCERQAIPPAPQHALAVAEHGPARDRRGSAALPTTSSSAARATRFHPPPSTRSPS